MATYAALEGRVDTLEAVLGHFIASTNAALLRMERGNEAFKLEMKEFKGEMREFKSEMKDFKDEMTDFKDEMKDFKDETRADRKRMNKQWGDLANKMGTLVEDIVAPNIPRVAREYFQLESPDFFGIRIKKRKAADRSLQREFDVIAVYPEHVLVNETKATPRIEYIEDFVETLPQFADYFPEYRDKTLIPIFSSLSLPENIVSYLSQHSIYGMGMGDETMVLLNDGDFSKA